MLATLKCRVSKEIIVNYSKFHKAIKLFGGAADSSHKDEFICHV